MNAIPQPAGHTPPDNPAQRWTVQAILDWTTAHLAAHGSTSPRLDAEILLARSRDCQRIELYTQYDQELTPQHRVVMRELVKRRAAREPVAYLVGYREFFGIDFEVNADTLIPRPDTETLVLELLDLARELPAATSILDIGTGSGCIAVSIATGLRSAQLTATDISPAALAVAVANATTHEVADRIAFLEGNLFEPLDSHAHFDFIVSNPPYVTTDEIDQLAPDIRDHEPHTALDGGRDGLDLIRQLIASAPRYLAPAGTLLCEISPEQADAVKALLGEQPAFGTPRLVEDLAGEARVVVVSLQNAP
jgi:release factor glutamine methyltransferase